MHPELFIIFIARTHYSQPENNNQPRPTQFRPTANHRQTGQVVPGYWQPEESRSEGRNWPNRKSSCSTKSENSKQHEKQSQQEACRNARRKDN